MLFGWFHLSCLCKLIGHDYDEDDVDLVGRRMGLADAPAHLGGLFRLVKTRAIAWPGTASDPRWTRPATLSTPATMAWKQNRETQKSQSVVVVCGEERPAPLSGHVEPRRRGTSSRERRHVECRIMLLFFTFSILFIYYFVFLFYIIQWFRLN